MVPAGLGCSGENLGGNATLIAAGSAGEPVLEGTVGGNLNVSSRLQAVCVGYGWSDILHMGPDLAEEYRDYPEEVRRMKFDNSDGPKAPLGEVIGFTGEGKGIKVLRDYMAQGKKGTDPYLDEMLAKAILASPVSHIGPDFPPAALFSGLGMVRVDIPDRQSYRTFETCSRYGADCFLFANTNGNYGQTAPVVNAICGFFDAYLRGELPHKKTVARPGSAEILENYRDCSPGYPLFAEKDGEIYAAAESLEEFPRRRPHPQPATFAGREPVRADDPHGTHTADTSRTDTILCVLVPAAVWAGNQPKSRTY